MKKFVLTILSLIAMINPALANHTPEHSATKEIKIEVNGLVCDFCARAVEKVFYKEEGVEGVDVNLDTHIVTINILENKDISDEKIKKLVKDSGYNLVKIQR